MARLLRERAHPPRPPAASVLWGDGFARDGLGHIWAVRDWSLCSSDEFIIPFPQLIPQAGDFPPVLRAHLEACVAVRSRRLARLDQAPPHPLRSLLRRAHEAGETAVGGAAVCERAWFAEDARLARLLRRSGLIRTSSGRLDAERGMLRFLDRILHEIQMGRLPTWDEAAEVGLAFGAGIHPAYLWSQATVSEARGIAAGWLGHLDRGRAALMPLVVAEYVLDALGAPSTDRELDALVGSAAKIKALRRSARRRWSGRDPVVRWTPGATLRDALFADRSGPEAAARA